ncbi:MULTISPECIES: flagellar biosynthesis protein FlhA [Pseudomonas]|uniref:flagellar biosynthesis protein FlhA n=1 Tax=Pseudomonas TaxID=286 RepID=UPI00102A9EF3|nr:MULTISPECIES: flagellar biosynthesis protein FlhA [Pseudomonas]MBH8610370.1 flagellar biosynthesis protein FlhA [Pseudomonas mohnii]MBM6443012.1 flagellar biosynthesis protein FlhA [Pseudomonas sp. MIL9]RZO10885.1 flagellar biosynthesis protein FlhA [Pseudomonas moorei]
MKGMTDLLGPDSWLARTDLKIMTGPALIVLILSMMILPLPTFILDLLFTFNIALAIMVLMVSMLTEKPLDFSAFPSVLLFTTLLRLSLNVASTRVILMEGHTGPDAAGKVIEAFGEFLVGGNFAVGLALFLILVTINFMVITKGAGRIAEVGARFTLDSMPGKQMAIDADLNAGLIGEPQARQRRKEVAQEADFFGSMDGASKFVRGDAVAGLVIMGVCIIGGLAIGILQHDMAFADAAHTYTMLTIGDGLVAQIPGLVISIAAGVTVSRVNTEQDVGQQMMGQLFSRPKVLMMTAGVMGLLGLVPGMPNLVFLILTGLLGGLGWWFTKQEELPQESSTQTLLPKSASQSSEASWDDVHLVDTLSLRVGHRLIQLVDARQQGELITRIKSLRKKFAQDVGFLPPVVHVRDKLELSPNTYIISLKGVEIGRGEVFPGKWLAINPGKVTNVLEGTEAVDPAFGLPAIWIEPSLREHGQIYGYTVVDASTVTATHLNHLLHQHAKDMLGRGEVQKLLDKLGPDSKGLIDEVVPKMVSLTVLQRVLQNLLEENVSIRDMRTILDALAEHGGAQQPPDVQELTAVVRIALGRSIVNQLFANKPELKVIGLDFNLEQVLMQAVGNGGSLEPSLADNLMQQTSLALKRQEVSTEPPVLVVPNKLRPVLSRFLRRRLRQLTVISLSEVPDDRTLRMINVIGGTPK